KTLQKDWIEINHSTSTQRFVTKKNSLCHNEPDLTLISYFLIGLSFESMMGLSTRPFYFHIKFGVYVERLCARMINATIHIQNSETSAILD
uniref:Uncharacterized protein n=1 Tax=Ciona savignyi TaxID=51511 RepID=H2Z222_CIOSA